MPKEISHLILADRMISCLNGQLGQKDGGFPASIRFSIEAASVYPNLVRFGATTPDTIFYFAFLPKSGDSRNIVNRSHGAVPPGSFSWIPVFKELILRSKKEREKEIIHAYALGILSHLAADYTFHPLVHHFAPSDRSHHLLETQLDGYLLEQERSRNGEKGSESLYLKDIAQRAEKESEGLLHELFCSYANSFVNQQAGEQVIAMKRCRQTLNLHCRIQRLFFSPLVRTLLVLPSLIFPEKCGKYLQLFYHGKGDSPFLESLAIEQMESEATKTFLNMFTLFNNCVKGKTACPEGLDADRGNKADMVLQYVRGEVTKLPSPKNCSRVRCRSLFRRQR
ncbi:MAG: zinc dependent phospholipase C family protein [Spirochaetaceae bacterium]